MDKLAEREEGRLEGVRWRGCVGGKCYVIWEKLFQELPTDDGQHNCPRQGGFTRWNDSMYPAAKLISTLHWPSTYPAEAPSQSWGPWILHKMLRGDWKFLQTSSTPLNPSCVLLCVGSGLIQRSSSEGCYQPVASMDETACERVNSRDWVTEINS